MIVAGNRPQTDIVADIIIDYKNENFEALLNEIDIVLEASPNRDNSQRIRSVSVLKKGGTFVSVNLDTPFNEEMMEALNEKQCKGELSANKPSSQALSEIATLIDEGKVKIEISKTYPLQQVSEAHRMSETWHVRGKLILEVLKEN